MINFKSITIAMKLPTIGFALCIAIWLALQAAVVLTVGDIPGESDAMHYELLARECVEAGTWYPSPANITGDTPVTGDRVYLCYPGLINIIIISLRLFGSVKGIYWLNIIFNAVTAWSIMRIGRDLAGLRFGRIAALLYCMTPYSVLAVAQTMSEIPFMSLGLLAIALIGRRRAAWLILSGILLIIAQYVRTVALIYAVGAFLYMLMTRVPVARIVTFAVGLAAGLVLVLAVNFCVSGGHLFLSSTTLGINMIQGAADETSGAYCEASYNKKRLNDAVADLDVFACDSAYREASCEWISSNPGKWLGYIPAKVRYYLCVNPMLDYGRTSERMRHNGTLAQVRRLYPYIFQVTLYVAALAGLWIRRRQLWGADGAILLVYAAGIALTILTVGDPRYQIPFLPCLYWFASFVMARALKSLTTQQLKNLTT